MNMEDPEERIRQLEQAAAQHGAVELGTQPYREHAGAPPTAPMYGAPYRPPIGNRPPAVAAKGIPGGLVLGIAAIFVVIVLCGVGVILWNVVSSV
jgi:hypothetical protein